VAQGRVFVDGKRVDLSPRQVGTGSRVTWVASRLDPLHDDNLAFEILDRSGALIIVAKPAAWSSEPDRSGHATSLREQVKSQLNLRDVHVVTRLDIGVSGLVLVAVGEDACRQSTKLQTDGQLKKHYLAMATGSVTGDQTWSQSVDGTRSAQSECHPLAHSEVVRFSSNLQTPVSFLHINAITGRHHQIRVHAATNGHPLLGDRRYGGPAQFVTQEGNVRSLPRPMLHAWKLEIVLPDRRWTTTCEVPSDMRQLWAELGGTNCWPKT